MRRGSDGSFEEALRQAVGSAVETLQAGEAAAIQGVQGAVAADEGGRIGHGRAAFAAIGARDPRQGRLRLSGDRPHGDLIPITRIETEYDAMRALAIAATGMSAQEQNLEVIANNIANINTTGFKRSRAEFTDLIYQTERQMGVSNRGRDATIPEGAQIGLGVRTAAIRSVNMQGALTNTGNTLDLAINGRGWFQVTTPNGEPSTRATARSTPTRTANSSPWTAITVTPPISSRRTRPMSPSARPAS